MPKVRFVEWEPTDPEPLAWEAEYDLSDADVIVFADDNLVVAQRLGERRQVAEDDDALLRPS